jgi:hypothetical protein
MELAAKDHTEERQATYLSNPKIFQARPLTFTLAQKEMTVLAELIILVVGKVGNHLSLGSSLVVGVETLETWEHPVVVVAVEPQQF